MLARSVPDPLGAATARAQREATPTFNVPLFRSLLERLDVERRAVVLDLGSAKPTTIRLLSQFRCRLDIADLDSTALQSPPEDEVGNGFVAALLPEPSGEPTDLVLCWDYLDYCHPTILTRLMEGVAERCRDGALVHALLSYADSVMQPAPGCFSPIDEGRLCDESEDKATRPAPRYSAEELRLLLPRFRVERACLLRNGMQEYLFSV